MTNLSPAAQAIKDAVLLVYKTKPDPSLGWTDDVPTIAASLRAAALYCKRDRLQLLATAAELEGVND